MEMCSELYNEYVEWAFKNKCYSKAKAHKELYFKFREQYPLLPSAMIQSIRDVALEAVKANKFKFRPKKKKYSAIRYDKRIMTLRGEQLTFSGFGKRNIVILNVCEYYKPIFENEKFKGGTICYNSKTKQFTAKLQYELKDPEPSQNNEVLGIDRGIYNIVTCSNGLNIDSKELRKIRRKRLYLRRKLQAKGTRSAKRKLKQLSGKEKRFSLDTNHCISKKIVNLNYGTFVLEDLNFVKTKKTRSKKANNWLSSWTFSQLQSFLEYKAFALGKKVVYVDARYTSQKCSACGSIDKHNRSNSRFKCLECNYVQHADINASYNIKNNYLSSLHQAIA